jgi:hypothetical protein
MHRIGFWEYLKRHLLRGGDELLPVPKISQSWMQVAEGWGLDCIAGVVIIICTFIK